jgi:hypothetical protein
MIYRYHKISPWEILLTNWALRQVFIFRNNNISHTYSKIIFPGQLWIWWPYVTCYELSLPEAEQEWKCKLHKIAVPTKHHWPNFQNFFLTKYLAYRTISVTLIPTNGLYTTLNHLLTHWNRKAFAICDKIQTAHIKLTKLKIA